MPGWQRPWPSQVRSGTKPAPEHMAEKQTVPAGCLRQARAPSQVPTLVQVLGWSSEHSLSGSVLSSTGAHRPSSAPVLLRAQASQSPVQALPQQTPSTQAPEAHAAGEAHGWPAGIDAGGASSGARVASNAVPVGASTPDAFPSTPDACASAPDGFPSPLIGPSSSSEVEPSSPSDGSECARKPVQASPATKPQIRATPQTLRRLTVMKLALRTAFRREATRSRPRLHAAAKGRRRLWPTRVGDEQVDRGATEHDGRRVAHQQAGQRRLPLLVERGTPRVAPVTRVVPAAQVHGLLGPGLGQALELVGQAAVVEALVDAEAERSGAGDRRAPGHRPSPGHHLARRPGSPPGARR